MSNQFDSYKWLKNSMLGSIHILPNQATEQIKHLRPVNDAIVDSMQYAFYNLDNLKIDGKSIVEATAAEIKPITVGELSEQYHQLQIENAMNRLHSQVYEEFLNVLKRQGISKEQWQEYGTYSITEQLCSYSYKDKCIFKVSYPKLELQPDVNKGEYTIYYWEERGVD